MKPITALLLAAAAVAAPAAAWGLPAGPAKVDDDRIVGGNDTAIEKIPYQVSMEKYSSHSCGGSVLSSTWILSAAHCLVSVSTPSTVKIRAGSTSRGNGGSVIEASKVLTHPQYSSSALDYDVGLIELAEALTFSAQIQPVALTEAEPRQGDTLLVSGWGTLNSGDYGLPTTLQSVRVPALSRKVCAAAYASMNKITDRMICAGVGGKDSCQGDSGGPLVNEDGQQVGVVSWGRGCALAGYPGVYANVANEVLRAYIKTNAGV